MFDLRFQLISHHYELSSFTVAITVLTLAEYCIYVHMCICNYSTLFRLSIHLLKVAIRHRPIDYF
jgi:hypothetical protein